MSLRLSTVHADYIRQLWRDLREANRMVRRFDEEWNLQNHALNVLYEGQDPLQISKKKSENLILSDAFAAGKWWMEKARWLAAAIQAEKAAMEMLNGDDGAWEQASPSASLPLRS